MSKSTPAAVLEATRDRHQAHGGRNELHGTIHAYCPNSECAVREVWLFVKEHYFRTPDVLVCPACHRTLDVHDVRL